MNSSAPSAPGAFPSSQQDAAGPPERNAPAPGAPFGTQPPAPDKVRILVVEDDAFFREIMVKFINRQPGLICCGQTDSIRTTPAAVAELKPTLILMDLHLADGDVFELIGSLKLRHPQIGILILSQCDEPAAVARALRSGANGYITKQEAPDQVLNGIQAVSLGKVYVSPELSESLLQSLFPRRADSPASADADSQEQEHRGPGQPDSLAEGNTILLRCLQQAQALHAALDVECQHREARARRTQVENLRRTPPLPDPPRQP